MWKRQNEFLVYGEFYLYLILNFWGALCQFNVNLRFQYKINNTTAIEIGVTTSRILPVLLFNIHIFSERSKMTDFVWKSIDLITV